MTYYILSIIIIVLIIGYSLYLHYEPIYSNKVQFRMVETNEYRIQFRNNKYCFWNYVTNEYGNDLKFIDKDAVELWIKKFYVDNVKIKNKKITSITVKIKVDNETNINDM